MFMHTDCVHLLYKTGNPDIWKIFCEAGDGTKMDASDGKIYNTNNGIVALSLFTIMLPSEANETVKHFRFRPFALFHYFL